MTTTTETGKRRTLSDKGQLRRKRAAALMRDHLAQEARTKHHEAMAAWAEADRPLGVDLHAAIGPAHSANARASRAAADARKAIPGYPIRQIKTYSMRKARGDALAGDGARYVARTADGERMPLEQVKKLQRRAKANRERAEAEKAANTIWKSKFQKGRRRNSNTPKQSEDKS